MTELKLYAIVNMEAIKAAKGNRGKILAQAGHAFLHSFWDAESRFPTMAHDYKFSRAAVKIALRGETAEQLVAWHRQIRTDLPCALIVDSARTVFTEPTVTMLGIGPIAPEMVPDWLKQLPVLL